MRKTSELENTGNPRKLVTLLINPAWIPIPEKSDLILRLDPRCFWHWQPRYYSVVLRIARKAAGRELQRCGCRGYRLWLWHSLDWSSTTGSKLSLCSGSLAVQSTQQLGAKLNSPQRLVVSRAVWEIDEA